MAGREFKKIHVCQLPVLKSAGESCRPEWKLPLSLGYFETPVCALNRDSVFHPLCLAEGQEPAGLVQMDAILNCRADDLEDYYNLLGCDELSTVRAFPSSPMG